MLKSILAGVVVVLGAFVAVVATRPATFTVTRSATIAAAPTALVPMIDDFHQWQAWSPWEGLDPQMTRTYSGADAGVGAKYAWSSDKKNVGAGDMTVTDVKPDSVDVDLNFLRPFPSHNEIAFTLAPAANGATLVTWTMTGHKNFMAKAVMMFMDMDKQVGPDFEKGLAQLKAKAEAAPAPAATPAPTTAAK